MISPVYDKKTMIIQLVIVVLFSLSLYLFLYSIQNEKYVRQELLTVDSQRRELQQIHKSVETYNRVVTENSALENLTAAPSWERVDFKWKGIGFTELLGRIDTLSHQRKLFVVESFKAGLENPKGAGADALNVQGEMIALEQKERFYHLRGYFLCPCL